MWLFFAKSQVDDLKKYKGFFSSQSINCIAGLPSSMHRCINASNLTLPIFGYVKTEMTWGKTSPSQSLLINS